MEKIKSYFRQHKRQIIIMSCMALMMCLSFALSVSASGGEGANNGLTNVGTVADFLWTQIGSVVTTIVSTPLLLIPIGIFVAGAAIGLAKRFIGR